MVTIVQPLTSHNIELSLLRGKPFQFSQEIFIYSPTIAEIEEFGEEKFFSAINGLTLTQLEADAFLENRKLNINLTAMQLFFEFMRQESERTKTELVLELLTHNKVVILPEYYCIILGANDSDSNELSDENVITKDDFYSFQNAIRKALGRAISIEEDLSTITDPKILAIKKKLRQGEIARAKAKAQQNSQGENCAKITLNDMILSIVVYTGLTIDEVFSYSYFALCNLYDRIRDKELYNEETIFMSQGVKIKNHRNWMVTNINKGDE